METQAYLYAAAAILAFFVVVPLFVVVGPGRGNDWFQLLRKASAGSTQAKSATATITLGPPRRLQVTDSPYGPNGLRVRKGQPLTLPPKHRPLWYEKGWRKGTGKNEYAGQYTAAGRRWRGHIVQPYDGRYEAYIWDPPMSQLADNTYHSACFSSNGKRSPHRVHFSVQPSSLDHAITTVEVLLHEAMTGRSYH